MVETTNNNDLLVKLQAEGDWNMTAVFNDKQTMITQNKCTLGKDEIEFYTKAYESRDTTVGEGFFIESVHFDVHRFHPPLVYGRRGGPDDGEGIALCRFKPKTAGEDEEFQYFSLPTCYLSCLP